MSARPFDPNDCATWPLVLSLDQVAAIYGRSREAIRHSLKASYRGVAFQPAPFRRNPAQWRRSEVERDVIGARAVPLRRVS